MEAVLEAEVNGKEAPVQPDVSVIEPEVTSELLTQASRKGDLKAMEEARKKLFSKPDASPENKLAPPEVKKAPEPQQAAAQKKVFTTKYKGTEIERDDSDGYLGMKNPAELKKSWIHKNLTIEELEKRQTELRSHAEAKEREAAEYRAKYEAANKPVVPPVVEPKTAQAIERPKAPDIKLIAELPDDPTDWTSEQGKQFKEYQKQQADYQAKMGDYIDSFKSIQAAPVVKQELPEEYKQELEMIRSERQATQQKAAAQNYWKGVEEFQKKHKEFSFKSNPEELHGKVLSWMDKLAEGLGAQKPFQQGTPEWNNYIQKRDEFVGKYLQGDKDIIEKAEGINPPEDYDKYFKIAELERIHASLKNDNTLGNNSTLHDAYIKNLDLTGQMEQGVNSMMADQFSKGADAITKVLKKSDNAARSIPPEVAQQDFAPVTDVAPDELKWFSSFIGKPQLVMRLPSDEKAKFYQIQKKLNWTN